MNTTILVLLLQARSQFHIWHWQTKSYAEHKALGKAYDICGDYADRLAEMMMGSDSRPEFSETELSDVVAVTNYTNFKSVLEYLSAVISDVEGQSFSSQDAVNTRDELVGELNKIRYLLTLQ